MYMPKGYKKSETCVFFMNFHYIWCPKYRRPVLKGKIAARCEALIREKVKELEGEVLSLEVMPDHIHLFVVMPPTISANKVIGQIKGYTSRILRSEFPELKKMPTLWTRSYFVSTHGHVSSEQIQKYIEEQKGR
jgi:putative transposase